MAKHHNLGTVIWFEFTRTIKKPSFWAATLSFPILVCILFAIVFYSSQQTQNNTDKLSKEKFSIVYKDDSGVVVPKIAEGMQAKRVDDKAKAIEDVRNQKVDAFFYYPKNASKNTTEVYGKDSGLFENGKYDAIAKQLLILSANSKINSNELVEITKGNIKTNVITYLKNGEKSAGWMAAIPPLLFLALFYMAIVMLGSNLLNSTVEEKENRVTEMILTTLNPTDLIVGKLLATFLAGIVQTLVILTPIVIAYLLLGSNSSAINLPDLGSINQLVIDPIRMLVGGLILVGGTLLFTGSLMALGAIMPTAKEASQWFSIVILAMFIPFYIISLILSDPNQLIVQIFTFFPFTSPVTAMLRNAFASLDSASSAVVITVLIVLGILIIRLAVHLFRYGAMQYDSKLSLKGILKR